MTSWLVTAEDEESLRQELPAQASLVFGFGERFFVVRANDPPALHSGSVIDPSSIKDAKKRHFIAQWRLAERETPTVTDQGAADGYTPHVPTSAKPAGAPPLLGSVPIGLVVVDSNQSPLGASDAHHWQQQALSALSVLHALAPGPLTFFPRLEWVRCAKPPGPYSGGSDPLSRYESGWVYDALYWLGHPSGSFGKYLETLRKPVNAHTSLAVVMTTYPLAHYGYYRGGVVMISPNATSASLAWVVAHEVCHHFGAAEEFGTAGANCMMRDFSMKVCAQTAAEMGW
ncbi:MAG: hypothetical protein JJ863_24780 [Deltaproteobacteria bacterium]|nr:hypothetical protein [Deltaproteobacteria bacterium]